MKETTNGIMWVVIAAVAIIHLSGCTGFARKPVETTEHSAKVHTTGKYNVDAPTLIQELSESGCELTSLVYEEGRQKAVFTAKCRNVGAQ